MKRSALRILGLFASGCLAVAGSAVAAPNCTGASRLMQWPSPANPVWEFCFLTPMSSTSQTGNGSGLDIFDVHYNGHMVLERAHAPILNVLYAPGASCFCFRDWSDQEVRFSADNVIAPGPGGYAEPTTPATTVCESGGSGGDVGSFRGVSAEKATDLLLTTQFQAGWYRYTMRWQFALDGTITASFGFAAINATCVSFDHTHHNYWRLDFDIDGPKNDAIVFGVPSQEIRGTPPAKLPRESKGNWSPNPDLVAWDYGTQRGYRIVPGNTNVPDTFAVADYWLLQYHANEIDDAGQPGPSCAIKIQDFLNNELLHNQDVVVWLRGGAFHEGQELDHCGTVGFTLQPVGDWNP